LGSNIERLRMNDVGYWQLLLQREFVVTMLAAIAAFSAIITLALPYIQGSPLEARMKAVAERRDELRLRQRESLSNKNRGQLRSRQAAGFMKTAFDNLNLEKLTDSPGIREKLIRAGMRGQGPLVAFMFCRFVMPIIMLLAALVYVFAVAELDWPWTYKLAAAVAAAAAGYYSPDIYVTNRIQSRQASIMRAFPDALDLLLICVESGMSIETAFNRVASEVGSQSIELAEELGLTTAELSYLPDRKVAFQNLSNRCAHPGVRAVAAALVQSEKYGTPMGQALRVTAQENREMRMSEAERKAAALPAKLTVPMILFFLPCLFVVILGPAAMKIMAL
jgi:tight adherence protein C